MTLGVSAGDYAAMPRTRVPPKAVKKSRKKDSASAPLRAFNVECGKRLAATRKARDLTQAELAQQTHLSRSAIGNSEQGTRGLDGESAVKLADRLGVATDWLLRGDPSNLPGYLAETLLGPPSSRSDEKERVDIRAKAKLPA